MNDDNGDYPARRAGSGQAPQPSSRPRSSAARAHDQASGRVYGQRPAGTHAAGARPAATRPSGSAGARPAARGGGQSASRSGRIPAQRHPSPSMPAAGGPTRPRRSAETTRNRDRARQQEAAASYQNRGHYLRSASAQQRGRLGLKGALAGLGVLAVVIVGVFLFAQSLPANITLNGTNVEVRGGKTIEDAIAAGGIAPKPGDFVAVDGSVLEAGKGHPFHAAVNGEAVTDPKAKVASGDVVEIGDGGPVEEDAHVAEAPIPWTVTVEGNGAIHLIEGQGKDGVKATKTGKVSGIVAEQVTQEPSNIVQRNVSPDVGDDKVVALTFDDGPWSDQTGELLDVLAEHGAKATFFTVGDRIGRDNGASFVKRTVSDGHQMCTHTFDHAAGSGQGVNLGFMTPEEQIAEIEKGYAAIKEATGAEVSRVIRTPGGNFGPEVARNIGPLISAEIGWDIDTGDWGRPGAEAIAQSIKGAWPGAIILMHDGGGDRSQTIEALKMALPHLKDQGYRFVTMDELLQYPLS